MVSRRRFLNLTLALPVAAASGRAVLRAAQGLDKFTTPGVACKTETLTPLVADDKTFRAGSPERTNLAEPNASGPRLILSGIVKGLVCGPIRGARLEFWQADAQGRLDATGFRLRGHQVTEADGRYHLETIVPGASAGHARRLNARVEAPGKPALTTALFFPSDAANAKDPAFKQELLITMSTGAGPLTATFDFVLDA